MRKNFLMAFVICIFILIPALAKAQLANRLSGRILLQVQQHGEAWYVYPANKLRYYMGRPFDAFQLMSRLSLGISNKDFTSFGMRAPARLAGYILLKVEDFGKAYYVNPLTLNMHYLGRPDDAFQLMRQFGLGITNTNLESMPVSGESAVPPGDVLNIVVTQPQANTEVDYPLLVQGQARVFENTLNMRVRNANNKILVEDFTTALSPDIGQFGSFSKQLFFPAPGTTRGTVEVFSLSARDGSEINKIIIPIIFKAVQTTTVKAYFGNTKKDPSGFNCNITYPVDRRIPQQTAVGRAAIEQLLAGPTANERTQGYFTSLNSGVQLNSLTITDGVARADFNEILEQGVGGSCRVAAIASQIVSTLKQFPTVQQVIISVNGRTEDILQP